MTTKRNLKRSYIAAALAAMCLSLATPSYAAEKSSTFKTGKGSFLLNDKPFVVKAAEVHYTRIPKAYWDHRIKMCKALGMNTVCMYIFWNIHEQEENKFDFTGQNDIAEFVKLCQKNGMYVIVRPGPYVCAEWEMGGLPWWLLKKKDIKLRERDPYFMQRVDKFEEKVAEQLAPLTIQNGGPIIMLQVENEYGSYGEDKAYVSEIRDVLKKYWNPNPLMFQCDWSSNFTKNGLDDLVWTMNFGTGANIDQQFKKLGELRPDAPKMCSEFWSGWFDKWGAKHETRAAKDMVDGIDQMLQRGISFSLYMTHGGTSFGHWAGANSPGFAPDVTSYDYDAPINEYGLATEKYYELRKLLEKYSDKKLPSVPKQPMPFISFPKVELKEFAPLANGAMEATPKDGDLTFEAADMGWGTMVYTTTLPEIASGSTLTIDEAHDYAQVFIDNKYIGKIDRVKHEKSIKLPQVNANSKLTIVVEAMGRINFGRAIKDYKGITGKVTIERSSKEYDHTWTLKNWSMYKIPDDMATAYKALSNKNADKQLASTLGERGYYRGYFTISKVGDTFINMETWGKGQVYVNGHALGRFWRIGPQQTLYCPGCWLKKGKNEIVVLDIAGPQETMVWGQDRPEINKLQKDGEQKAKSTAFTTKGLSITAKGSFKAGNGWQTVKFSKQTEGRYLVIEALNAQNGKNVAAIAELYALDKANKRISREPWTIKYVDTEDTENGNNTGNKVFDLQESTYWQTAKGAAFPHTIVIDLGSKQTINGIEYLPRAEEGAPGSIKDYNIYCY